jgi:hypothetical protein
MIKTNKDILIIEKGESKIIPAGTYAEADDNYNYWFLGSEGEGYYVSQKTIEANSSMFSEVNVNEYEILTMIKSLVQVSNRISVTTLKSILSSLKESHPELISEFLQCLGQEDVEALNRKIKELESQLFIERMNKQNPYTTQPYVSTNCGVCGIDLMKNTGYVCFNQNCPTRVWVTNSTSNGTELKFNSTSTFNSEEE